MTNHKLMMEQLLNEKYQLLLKIRDIYHASQEKATPLTLAIIDGYQEQLNNINELIGINDTKSLRR